MRAGCRCGTGVHRKNRRDLSSLLTNGDLHAELRAGLDSIVPSAFQYGSMKKHVARPVGQFNETEAFFCVEPLD